MDGFLSVLQGVSGVLVGVAGVDVVAGVVKTLIVAKQVAARIGMFGREVRARKEGVHWHFASFSFEIFLRYCLDD